VLLFVLLLAAATPETPAACKAFDGGPCCDREVSRHLSRYAIFNACRDTSERYLGERGEGGSTGTCRYVFGPKRTRGEKPDPDRPVQADGFVEISVPARSDVPEQPDDPFFAWTKVGKAFVAYKAKTPNAAPMLAATTGIWLPGDGYVVSVTASTKVCSRGEAQKLAKSVR
jgi:hypothetical protein